MDCMNPTVSQSSEEREVEMFSLVVGFAMRMRKQVANAHKGTMPGPEVPVDKRFRLSRSDEEVQVDLVLIAVDLPERVLKALFVVGGVA